jgi:hypothetical protein
MMAALKESLTEEKQIFNHKEHEETTRSGPASRTNSLIPITISADVKTLSKGACRGWSQVDCDVSTS